MNAATRISYEEFAGNFAEILGKVRDEHTALVVEYASGEKLIIRPLLPTRPGSDDEAVDSSRQPPQRPSNTENISSVGAVHDLDPNSITPG